MSNRVDDVYKSMSMGELFREWNESNKTYEAREEIRRRLQWRKGRDMWTLIQTYCAQEELPFDTEDPPATVVTIPRRSKRIDDRKMWELIKSQEGKVSVVVDPILNTGWDFVDIREEGHGRFDRPPDLNQEFLEDMMRLDAFIDELSESQIGLLIALFRAWRYWHRRRPDAIHMPNDRSKPPVHY